MMLFAKLVVVATTLVTVSFNSYADAGNLRGDVDCGRPPQIYQGSTSYSSTKAGSSVRFTCMRGTVMSGSASATCTKHGTWSNQPPECRVVYSPYLDNTYRNGDKGYKLYSG